MVVCMSLQGEDGNRPCSALHSNFLAGENGNRPCLCTTFELHVYALHSNFLAAAGRHLIVATAKRPSLIFIMS